MKKQPLFLIIFIAGLVLFACKKPSEVIEGVYSGSVLVNATSAGSGTVVLSTVNDNTIDLKLTVNTNPSVIYNNVIIAGVENPYSISYTSVADNLYGGVNGDALNFTIYDTSGTETSFSGTKY
jgi:hypothetical protein